MAEIVLDGIPVGEMLVNVKYPSILLYDSEVIGTWKLLTNGMFYGSAIRWKSGAGTHEWYEEQLYKEAYNKFIEVYPKKRSKIEELIASELLQTKGSEALGEYQDKDIRGPLTLGDLNE